VKKKGVLLLACLLVICCSFACDEPETSVEKLGILLKYIDREEGEVFFSITTLTGIKKLRSEEFPPDFIVIDPLYRPEPGKDLFRWKVCAECSKKDVVCIAVYSSDGENLSVDAGQKAAKALKEKYGIQ